MELMLPTLPAFFQEHPGFAAWSVGVLSTFVVTLTAIISYFFKKTLEGLELSNSHLTNQIDALVKLHHSDILQLQVALSTSIDKVSVTLDAKISRLADVMDAQWDRYNQRLSRLEGEHAVMSNQHFRRWGDETHPPNRGENGGGD